MGVTAAGLTIAVIPMIRNHLHGIIINLYLTKGSLKIFSDINFLLSDVAHLSSLFMLEENSIFNAFLKFSPVKESRERSQLLKFDN